MQQTTDQPPTYEDSNEDASSGDDTSQADNPTWKVIFWVGIQYVSLYSSVNVYSGALKTIREDLDMNSQFAGLVGGVPFFVAVMFSPWASTRVRRTGHCWDIIPYSIISILGGIGIAFSLNQYMLLVFACVQAIGWNLSLITQAVLDDIAEPGHRSRNVMYYLALQAPGVAMGNILGGTFSAHWRWVILAFALIPICGLYPLWRVIKDIKMPVSDYSVIQTWCSVLSERDYNAVLTLQLCFWGAFGGVGVFAVEWMQDVYGWSSGAATYFVGGEVVGAGFLGAVICGFCVDSLIARKKRLVGDAWTGSPKQIYDVAWNFGKITLTLGTPFLVSWALIPNAWGYVIFFTLGMFGLTTTPFVNMLLWGAADDLKVDALAVQWVLLTIVQAVFIVIHGALFDAFEDRIAMAIPFFICPPALILAYFMNSGEGAASADRDAPRKALAKTVEDGGSGRRGSGLAAWDGQGAVELSGQSAQGSVVVGTV